MSGNIQFDNKIFRSRHSELRRRFSDEKKVLEISQKVIVPANKYFGEEKENNKALKSPKQITLGHYTKQYWEDFDKAITNKNKR